MINDQPLDLKLVYNPINSICILPMNHRDKQISILHLKLGPAPWNVTTQRSYPPKPKVGDISPHAFSDARGPRVQSMAQHKWPGGKVNQGWSYSRNWWFGALTLWPSKMLM
jgi:hypothetical protein